MKRTKHLGPEPMGRRRFLGGLGAVGLGTAGLGTVGLGLAGCSSTAQSREVDLGGGSLVRVLNWEDYIDVDDSGNLDYPGGTVAGMAEQLGLTVAYDTGYSDNYDGFAIVETEAVNRQIPNYDIVVPTNWRAAQMINNGWAEPLPIEIIPNHANIDPAFLTNAWDRGCRYQMPWQAGITGIAYNPELTGRELTSVNDLFDPEFAGRVGFIGEMREAVGLAMLANGDDPSRPTRAAAELGLARVEQAAASGQVGAFTFNDFADKLRTGELAVAMAWSGDAAGLQADRPDIQFLVPEEGAIQWFDTMVIPAGSPNLAAAGAFMNFVYDPANAATITEWVQYLSPVLGVQEALASAGGSAAELAASPILFPDPVTRARLFTWGGLDQVDEDELDNRFGALLP